ncbi:MAG: YgiQ family radical SAM protein [Oscillospiraceae bacterium]|nr:YgiQ family radical SAM protein [Oscillospiraceae bacterium]
MSMDLNDFLPVSREDMAARGWDWYDILLVTGDAYVDHPSFGTAVIGRVLSDAGYRVAVLAQPDWHGPEAFAAMGRPELGVFINAGNLDSMVAHYTAAKKRRSEDFYSPGRRTGLRPDRACIVYANRAREAFPGTTVLLGGLEASLRRFAHYDYWDDRVRRSVLVDAKADILIYGMGETATREAADRLRDRRPLHGIRGSAVMLSAPPKDAVLLPSCEEVAADKTLYARAARTENAEHDPIRGHTLAQRHGDRYLVVYPPAMPLTTAQLDAVAALPYTREPHPMYDDAGGVPAIEEVRFSVIHNRGCFGGCNFCSLAFHQGRMVTSRSHASVIAEVEAMTRHPLWKGYVSDVGGPTANFRRPSCDKQLKEGMCPLRHCLAPKKCEHLIADHSDYLSLLRKLRAIPGVKKVFVRSGVRFDYVLYDKNSPFLSELVRWHISGQLKVAPEHCVDNVLGYMGKPPAAVYERFMDKYRSLNRRYGKEQFLVPYLMSSHPGSTLADAVELALYLKKHGARPEQVQDFYPTPGTISTCMYYTGIDPITMKPVYVARTPREKAMQRALLQYTEPRSAPLVREALRECGREDLIGTGPECLVRPAAPGGKKREAAADISRSHQSRRVSADGRGQKKSPGRAAAHPREDAAADRRGGRRRGRGPGHA